MLKAVVYDFDGTLTPKTIPEFKILEASGLEGGAENPKFFSTAWERAHADNVDIYEAMMLVILETAKQAGFKLTDENLGMGASERIYNTGVEEFLADMKNRGIENYLLSSGSQAYLQQLQIAPSFAEIYATVLTYDENGEANGFKRVMTAAEKSVALQEIAEHVNGTKDNFSGIVYIGDGPTDVDAMSYIKRHGGGAILIKHEIPDPNLPTISAESVDLAVPGDFTKDGELAQYLQSLIAA